MKISEFNLHILNEATYDIDGDVNMLFKRYVRTAWIAAIRRDRKELEKLKEKAIDRLLFYQKDETAYRKITNDTMRGLIGFTDSSELRDKQCKIAHELNPIYIFFSTTADSSHYNPINKTIIILVQEDTINFSIRQRKGEDFGLKAPMIDMISNERRHIKILKTIAHELSHWIDDSINNRHLEKKALIGGTKHTVRESGLADINHHYIEINSQIAGVKATRNKLGKKIWNNITLKKLFTIDVTLGSILTDRNKLISEKDVKKWLIKLIRRTDREGILGDKMNYDEISDLMQMRMESLR